MEFSRAAADSLFLKPEPDGGPSEAGLIWLKALSSKYRYEGTEMIHRVDLFTHQRRVTFLAMHLAMMVDDIDEPIFEVDMDRLTRMAYHHDDPEIVTGDLVYPIKAAMTEDERKAFRGSEDEAAYAVARFILGLSEDEIKLYIGDQREMMEKKTITAQVIDVADKWEALAEKTHEVRCGNESFAAMVENSREVFSGFERYPFWKYIKANGTLGFDKIPSGEEMLDLPRLLLDDIKSPEDAVRSVVGDGFSLPLWPLYYRSWAEITWINFYNSLEKAIFQGWYLELWKRWGTLPSDNTNAGLVIPSGKNVRKERERSISGEIGTIRPSGLWVPD